MMIKKHRKPRQSSYAALQMVHQSAHELLDMLSMLPDEDLAAARRQMYTVEDLIWQALEDRRHKNGKTA